MASETPRLDPTEIGNSSSSLLFRIVAQVKSQPSESTLILASPTRANEMITLDHVRFSIPNKTFEAGKWYEFICRGNDQGEVGFLILDSIPCVLGEDEEISLDAIVALQNLNKKFPEIY
ncbi:hypothetical protein NCAS_0I02910 [Naumovozyma castellii]|uniref:Replication factor A protein 3 n=1 Tax=Naumovozyma castellii TaxID=27288 RepID=G0VKC5_NAUCA|nr:hypothetical protein NCAS_0I02910 [Naumovozyma castellii CBS 4309]CCC71959.1 hypothetical protein NCAS_0I02910 [Naumovozyma castellii CBS 4309]